MIPGTDGGELLVGAVVLARLLLPLTILRWPLPGMLLSAVVVDSIERDVYLRFTDLTQEDYQRVDKALDAHYTVFAYLAMIRAWPSGAALRVGRFLFFYRLLGTAVFQVTGARWVLVLFPNVFDFFFLFYETMRLRWRPEHLASRPWIGIAAAIALLTVAKEGWIHVARLDVTDFAKEHLVGAPPEVPWRDVVAGSPWLLLIGAALAILVFLAGRGLIRWAAPDDHPGTRRGLGPLDAHAELGAVESRLRGRPLTKGDRPGRAVFEEALLVTLLVIVFSRALGLDTSVTAASMLLGPAVVLANSLLLHRRCLEGGRWRSMWGELGYRLVLSGAVVGAGAAASVLGGGWPDPALAAAFALGLALVVTLYDRSLAVHRERFGAPHPPERAGVR